MKTKIKILKSQFGLDEGSTHNANDYGDFYVVINGSLSIDVEKCNAEPVE